MRFGTTRGGARSGGVRGGCRAGFTLTELVVALLLLEVMLLGTVELLRLGLQQSREAELTERIIWEVTGLADSLEATAVGASGERDRPWGRLRWDATTIRALDLRDSVLLAVPVLREAGW